jgi:hypothetical protein
MRHPHLEEEMLWEEVDVCRTQSETTVTGNALSITRSFHVYANYSAHN